MLNQQQEMDYPLWSRVYVATEAGFNQAQSFFQYLVGQAGPGITTATDIDTNMPANGNLPASHEMLIYSIQIIPDEVVGQNSVLGGVTYTPGDLLPVFNVIQGMQKWRTYFDNLLFQLRIEQSKTYVEGRIDHFPQGGGLEIAGPGTVAILPADAAFTSAYTISNGMRTWEAARRLATPIYLGSLETFRGILSRPRGVTANQGTAPIAYSITHGGAFTVRLTGPRKRPTM
jgi:hypothetical protein